MSKPSMFWAIYVVTVVLAVFNTEMSNMGLQTGIHTSRHEQLPLIFWM